MPQILVYAKESVLSINFKSGFMKHPASSKYLIEIMGQFFA